tara:strand:- start:670 stop:1191 length:522 start_codon:yes stop_codon:yes gene_type:complete
MAEVLFCSKEDIVRRSPIIDGNIDADRLTPALHLSQTQNLRQTIGTDLYDYYVNAITALINNGTAIPANHLDLLNNYIKPILIHLTVAEYLLEGNFTVSNKGIFVHTSKNSKVATSQEVKELVQIERDRAESYKERFLDHMAFYASANFPEWYSNTNDDVSPDHESFTIDFVL